MAYKLKQRLRICKDAKLGPFSNQNVQIIEIDPKDEKHMYKVQDSEGSTLWLSYSQLMVRPKPKTRS